MDAALEMSVSTENDQKPVAAGKRPLLTAVTLFLFTGGFASPVIGLVFIIAHSVVPNDETLGRLGTVFMIVSIPMLLAGSHLMDLYEKH